MTYFCTGCGDTFEHESEELPHPSTYNNPPKWVNSHSSNTNHYQALCEHCHEELLMSDKPHHPDFIEGDTPY